jgi:uncharacterized membrane protein
VKRKGGYERVNFETSKNLGGVGAILMFIGIFPYVSVYGITELAGAILLLIAFKGFADYYREAGIFNDALYAIISGIVGAVAFVAIAVISALDFFTQLGITFGAGSISDWTTQVSQIDWQTVNQSILIKFAGFIFMDIIVLMVFMVITAILLRKSLKLLSAKTGVGLFGSTGTVLLVGAALTIAFGLGLLLVWISTLLLAIAFFQMRPQPPQPPLQPQNPTQT